MKKAKILSLVIMVLLVAVVFAALAIPAFANETTTVDKDGFEWNADGTKFKLADGLWVEKSYYDERATKPFLVATRNSKTGTWSVKGSSDYLNAGNDSNGAMGKAKDALKGNVYTYNDPEDLSKGGYYNEGALDAYIFMLSDYTMRPKQSDGKNEIYANISQFQGNLTIDMRGYKITADSTFIKDGTLNTSYPSIFSADLKRWPDSGDAEYYPSNYTIKNGSFSTYDAYVLQFKAINWDKDLGFLPNIEYAHKSYVFENVTFALEEGAKASRFFNTISASKSGDEAPEASADLILNNCTIDLVTNEPTVSTFLVYCANSENDAAKHLKINYEVNGGEILTNYAGKAKLTDFYDTENGVYDTSSFYFGKYNGEYLKVTIPFDTSALNSGNYTSRNGKIFADAATPLMFRFLETDFTTETYTKTYTLAPVADTFEFMGQNIDIAYEDASVYPFILFKGGSFFKAAKFYAAGALNSSGSGLSASNSAMTLAKDEMAKLNVFNGKDYGENPVSITINMRRDYKFRSYVLTSGENSGKTTYESYANTSQFQGHVYIDLGGHTLIGPEGANVIFDCTMKEWGDAKADGYPIFPTELTVRNGKIDVIGTRGMIGFGVSNTGAGKKLDACFENVDISVKSAVQFIYKGGTSSANGDASASVKFTNCTIDYSKSSNPGTSCTIFHLGDNRTNTDVTFEGGKIILGEQKAKISYTGTSKGKMTFAKYNGAYTVITADNEPTVDTAEGGKFNDGKLTLVRQGTTTTYILVPTATLNLNYTPKTSVTLGSDLVLNMYIPYVPELVSVSILGEKVTVEEIPAEMIVTLDDGKQYIHVEGELEAFDAAAVIPLTVELSIDGEAYSGKWSISIPKYVEKVLANSNIDDTEKALAKDILAYIRSAYIYDGMEDSDEVKEMNKILGTYTSDNVINVQNAIKDSNLKGATFVLNSTPAVRFYNGDYAYESFTFFVGGEKIERGIFEGYDAENGNFIEISLYAYQMTETFSYVIDVEDGEDITGAYNLISYYAYISGDGENDYKEADKALLTDLVAKFYNYCASAKAYRQYVIANQ